MANASLSEFFLLSNTYLNKWPCRNYLEKLKNKNELDKKVFFVNICFCERRVGSGLLLVP
jgi:hypothetical protein